MTIKILRRVNGNMEVKLNRLTRLIAIQMCFQLHAKCNIFRLSTCFLQIFFISSGILTEVLLILVTMLALDWIA
jgi:hypothetical protein